MGDLSAHFSKAEFRDHRTGALKGPSTDLVNALERLRAMVGRPLRIISGYRSPETNAAVGGARASRHLAGDAADIPRGYATVAQARSAGFTGIGHCGVWVTHVDVRPSPVVVVFKDCPHTY